MANKDVIDDCGEKLSYTERSLIEFAMQLTYLVVVGGFAGLQFVLRVLVVDAVARHLKSVNAG